VPYPRAHYYVLAVILVIIGGFWPTYFSVVRTVPWQFHAHGIAASLWVIMVAAQSWTAHHKRLPLHRLVGKSSLLLFPFLIAGLAAIIDLTGKAYVAGGDPFRTMFGGSLLMIVAIAMAGYVTIYYRALKYRRTVWVHSGYMLSTPLILFESAFHRLLMWYVPGFAVNDLADFPVFVPGIACAMAVELAIIAMIWLQFREKAKPFLVAAGFIVAQMLAMTLLKDVQLLKLALSLIGHLPSALVVAGGFAVGALTSWAGWNAGKRTAIPVVAAVQPA
jgi:hypothetical protein